MTIFNPIRQICLVATLLAAWPARASACPVCFGDPNSPMAIGASWGILLLLGVTLAMLAAFAGFFLYLVKRSRLALGERIEFSHSRQASRSV